MSTRYPVRRFLLIVLLSQAMVIQALLLGWSGARAVAGQLEGGIGPVCAASHPWGNGGGPGKPGNPTAHHDCLSACLAGPSATNLPEQTSLKPERPVAFLRQALPLKAVRRGMSELRAFLARAPPVLI